jgi:N-glycosylase/DNA lyase
MEELRRCGTGFRAKYLREAARMVSEGEVDLEEVGRLPYPEAKEKVMEIPGVGTKVADCFLLYGYGMMDAAPIDVWMHRVIQRLYLNGERLGQRRAEDFLRARFGSWAGYAQVYLYHYARMKHIL